MGEVGGHTMIQNYNDFIKTLLEAGFSMGGGKGDGIYSIVPWSWEETSPYDTPVRWHTGELDTDPWEWRIRVLDERDDIAYAKLFFKKSGFITKDWYHYFLAARRMGRSFEEFYEDGKASQQAKRIYGVVSTHEVLASHEIKAMAGFSKEEKSGFDRAMVELQMGMFLTTCGSRQKVSRKGEEYGWSSTVFCTTEQFFGKEMSRKAASVGKDVAYETIRAQVLKLNPLAEEKKIEKFVFG